MAKTLYMGGRVHGTNGPGTYGPGTYGPGINGPGTNGPGTNGPKYKLGTNGPKKYIARAYTPHGACPIVAV